MSHLPVIACIALGANVGERENNIRQALFQLGQLPGTTVLRTSDLIENPAVGGPTNAPDFLNAAAVIETNLSAAELLAALLGIERSLGRTRREKWEPRIIDLDLLLHGQQIISSDELTIPHPLMHARQFVLQPLAQIAPDLVHPVLRKKISTLLEEIN